MKNTDNRVRGFEPVVENPNAILPLRGTKDSAGYDFHAPYDIELKPNEQAIVMTDIKAYMQVGEVLMVFPRSSMGIKKGLFLANTVGVIDSDYYSNPSNDGNIGIAIKNLSDKTLEIDKGERFAQGVFIPFLVSDNCNSEVERTGGVGSTSK